MKKTFILGVGCQKGGTSWLYQYLHANIAVDMGFKKEYHVFDALYIDECRHFSDQALWQLKQALSTNNITAIHPDLLRLVGFYRDTESYFEYFDYLHCKREEISVVGDITPSYSALPANVLKNIKNGLKTRGFQIKVIFLLRDPLDRVWSHARMLRKRKLRNDPGHQFNQSLEEELLSLYSTPPFQIRTMYEKTISNLESVFNKEDIHYEFYETLFSEDSIKKITNFLSIPYTQPNLTDKINASPNNEDGISNSTARDIVNFYRNTYLHAINKFGHEKIEKTWSNNKHLKM